MERTFASHGEALVSYLCSQAGKQIDWQLVMASFTFDTIGEIAFGVNPRAMEKCMQGEKLDFLKRFDRIQCMSAERFLELEVVWRTMRFLNVGKEAVICEDNRAVRSYISKLVNERVKSGDWASKHDMMCVFSYNVRAHAPSAINAQVAVHCHGARVGQDVHGV